MKLLRFFILATGLLWSMGPHAEMIAIQEAIEAAEIKLVLRGNGEGYVMARGCPTCKFSRHPIDSNTVFKKNGRPISAEDITETQWIGGVVIYDTRTNHVVRLEF